MDDMHKRQPLSRDPLIGIICVIFLLVISSGSMELMGQGLPKEGFFSPTPTITTVPREFTGSWRGDNARAAAEGWARNCGSLRDHYGNPRETCEFPVDKLEPLMNGRMRAWIEFFDEPLSPRWDCVA